MGEGLVKAGRIIAIANIVVSLAAFALVLAIAIPTFDSAKTKAQDRTAQSDLRMALSTENAYAEDGDCGPVENQDFADSW